MRKEMHIAFGSIALCFVVALQGMGQAPPARQPEQAQPLPPQQGQAQPQAVKRDVVATVNGEGITRAEFEGRVKSALQARQRPGGEQAQLSDPQRQQIHQQVLNSLVEARLIEQHARKEGPDIAKEEVDGVIRGFEQKLRGQGLSLNEYLASNQQTVDDLRKRIEGALAWQKLQQQEMSPEKLRAFYEDQPQQFGGASFEEVQPQVTQLFVSKLWNDIVKQMKQQAEIRVVNKPQAAPQRAPQGQPSVPRR